MKDKQTKHYRLNFSTAARARGNSLDGIYHVNLPDRPVKRLWVESFHVQETRANAGDAFDLMDTTYMYQLRLKHLASEAIVDVAGYPVGNSRVFANDIILATQGGGSALHLPVTNESGIEVADSNFAKNHEWNFYLTCAEYDLKAGVTPALLDWTLCLVLEVEI
jgi:hypothetical protein